jgi:hypothetical protein
MTAVSRRQALSARSDRARVPRTEDPWTWMVEWTDDEGWHRERLGDVRAVDFSSVSPVRSFPAFRGQRNYTGWYFSTTVGCHLRYESLLERAVLTCLDFNPAVERLATQPLHLWAGGRAHRIPDIAVRQRGNPMTIVDVCPLAFVDRQRRADAHALMAAACEVLGWRHQVLSEPEPSFLANVRWLAGYKAAPANCADIEVQLRALGTRFSLREVDERFEWPALMRPAIFHLLWSGVLHCDMLTVKLTDDTELRFAA